MSASPPGGAAEAAWSHGYHLVAGGGQQRSTADWSLDPNDGGVAGGRSGGSPSGHRPQPSYPPEMSGWSQQMDTIKSGPPAASGRRILCRSQSEAGSSLGGRVAADSPSLADMAANYLPTKATTTAALYSSAALQNGHGYDPQSLAASPSGMERASGGGGGHLYHARSDVQQSEAAALRTPPPPLLHSTSLGDMKDRAVDIMAAKNASGRFLRPQDWNGPAAVRPPNQGGTRYFEPPTQSGHGESLIKRGRGEEEGAGGGSGGASPQDRPDACSHCGSHHGAGGCPLTNRGFAEKVSGGFLFVS
jgi:hypothetical protein